MTILFFYHILFCIYFWIRNAPIFLLARVCVDGDVSDCVDDVAGVEWLQPEVERQRLWRGQGPQDHTQQAVEAGRAYVQ